MAAELRDALEVTDPSARLQAAMDAGTRPDPSFVPVLVDRCGVEPDFNVREMLTWALVRHPADVTLPLVTAQLRSDIPQARSQALHTLSKIGDRRAWPDLDAALLFDADDTVARTAWRAAVILAPDEERPGLAATLVRLLGQGDRDAKFSLSRALAGLAPESEQLLRDATGDLATRVHALATLRLIDDPEEGFDSAMYEARASLAP
jgi:HEAT repeat protein